MATVTISEFEYNTLLDRSRRLKALEDEGVASWYFYSEAMSRYWDGEEEENDNNE